MFGWFRRKEYVNPDKPINIYEIIYTTARCRMPEYGNMGLGYTAVDEIADGVYKRWNELPLYERMNRNDNLFDKLQEFFKLEEEKYIRKMEVLKKEYGM